MSKAGRILVADDSLTIRRLVEMVLQQEGYEIVMAETGKDCLAKAKSLTPDLILLDYILPDMQGTAVCQALVNSPETWEIPVLLMSSNGNAIRQLYQDLNNVADYVTKPFAPNVLKAVVAHLLEKSKGEIAEEPTPAAVPSMSPDLLSKVNRVLQLLEQSPKSASTKSSSTARASKATPRPRARKPAPVATPPSDALVKKYQRIARGYLRKLVTEIPIWEQTRGGSAAENYYLDRLAPSKSFTEFVADLIRAAGIPAGNTAAFHCSTKLSPLDAVLKHVNASTATGELRIENTSETVTLFFEGGEPIFITSNNPRN